MSRPITRKRPCARTPQSHRAKFLPAPPTVWVRCLGLGDEHKFRSPDPKRCRVCPACRRKLDESLLSPRAEFRATVPG